MTTIVITPGDEETVIKIAHEDNTRSNTVSKEIPAASSDVKKVMEVFKSTIDEGMSPSIRQIRTMLACGQPRAQKVQKFLVDTFNVQFKQDNGSSASDDLTDYGNRRTAVYRLYNEDAILLYVGYTYDTDQRWKDHTRKQWWWDQVDEMQTLLHWYANVADAAAVEALAILTECPKYNVTNPLMAFFKKNK